MSAVLLRLAPVVTIAELQKPDSGRPYMLQSGCVERLFPDRVLPVVIDHDKSRVVGRVLEFYENDCWTGGRWLFARCEVTDPPAWLRKGTGCSWGYHSLQDQAMPGGWTRELSVAATEVSLLSPSRKPVDPLARVIWIEEGKDSSAVGTDRPAAGEVILGGRRIVRHNIGQVLGVR